MSAERPSQDKLARLAHWALTRQQRQQFAALAAQRASTGRRLAAINHQVRMRAEAGTGVTAAREMPQTLFATMLFFRHREIVDLLSLAREQEEALREFAASHRFRSADELAKGLGLTISDSPPLSANEP